MGRDQNDDRRRALVMGKFKFLYQDETEDLEAGDKFQLAVVQNKLLGPVKYVDKEGKDPDVLHIYGKEREPGQGFSNPDIKIPGVLDLFTVVWSNPFGDLFIDQDIKLFEFDDIQKYSGYNDGPKSREFCRFYTSSSSKELDGFDSSIFWSAGLLWKHFRTCGVEKWDQELRDLVDHYKNWKLWTHEVHNLTNNNSKFSENSFSGPASTSSKYSRDRNRSGNNNQGCSSYTATSAKQPPPPNPSIYTNTSCPPPTQPVVPPPPVGQTVVVPIPALDGSLVQVQLSTLPTPCPPNSLPPIPAVSSTSSRFKYINPQLIPSVCNLNTSQPPPGFTPLPSPLGKSKGSTWTNQVDDFLLRPKKRSSSGSCQKSRSRSYSPVTSSLNTPKGETSSIKVRKPKRKVTLVNTSTSNGEKNSPFKVRKIDISKIMNKSKAKDKVEEKGKQTEKKKKFTPKASILPPSPSRTSEVNELDIECKFYKGKILDWRGKFGFITSEEIHSKIFVHSKDIIEGRKLANLGVEAVFQVLHQDSSVVGAKAVNVKISK